MQRKKTLKEIWASKLKKSGFNDIETKDEYLKRYDSYYFASWSEAQHEEIRAYYNECQDFHRENLFYSKSDKYVWKLHCQGMTQDEIAKNIGVNQKTISDVIIRLTKKMKNGRD